jgi:hypothetical protein
MGYEAALSLEGSIESTDPPTTRAALEVNGSGGLGHLTTLGIPSDVLQTPFLTTFALPTLPFTGIQITAHNDPVDFAPGAGALTMPFRGTLRLCLVGTCNFVTVPLTEVQATRNVAFGASSGTIMRTNGLFGSITLSVGGPWTTGTLNGTTNGTQGPAGLVHGPLSLTSSTAEVGGVVQFVTPLMVSGSIFGNDYEFPLIARLGIELPEPGAAIALTCGAALLLLLGELRRRR